MQELDAAPVRADEAEGQVVVGEDAAGHLGDLGEDRLDVERAGQRRQERLEGLARAAPLVDEPLQVDVLDGQRRQIGNRLELARVLVRVGTGLTVNEPDHAQVSIGAAQRQHQHRPVAVLDQRPVGGKGAVELTWRVRDDDGKAGRVRPEARRVIGSPKGTIRGLLIPRSARAQRQRHRIVGLVRVPDPHRVKLRVESGRRGEPVDHGAEVMRARDGTRDRRARLAEVRDRCGRTLILHRLPSAGGCAPLPMPPPNSDCAGKPALEAEHVTLAVCH